MVNIEYAKALGLDLNNAPQINVMGVVNGTVETRTSTLKFRIKQSGDEIEIPANYVDSDNVFELNPVKK